MSHDVDRRENDDAPYISDKPKLVCLADLPDSITWKQASRSAEKAFRRGFTHGIQACIYAIRNEGAGFENLEIWLTDLMMKWRYGHDLDRRHWSPNYPIASIAQAKSEAKLRTKNSK